MEWNECLCMVWCSINNICEWCGVWSRHSIFRKGDSKEVSWMVGCALFGDSKEVSWIYWYIGFTWMKITSWWKVEWGSYGLVRGLKYDPDGIGHID